MKVTVQKVANGYVVTTEAGEVFVASRIDGRYGTIDGVAEILEKVLNPKDTEAA